MNLTNSCREKDDKRLEEELVWPIEEVKIPDEIEETYPVDEAKDEIGSLGKLKWQSVLTVPLPVEGLQELDREMDEYAQKAMNTFEDLCDLVKMLRTDIPPLTVQVKCLQRHLLQNNIKWIKN